MNRRNLLTTVAPLLLAFSASVAHAQSAGTGGVGGGPATAGPSGSVAPGGNTAPPSLGTGVNQAPATGGTAVNQVETVVVTAQKRSENIQNVPLSISSVSGQALQAAGVEDPMSLQKLVPSLDISPSFVASGIVIRIRGFGTAGNSGTDSDVASYLDGSFVPRPGTIVSSFLDVKNVEVLNGPQGTLFGRNAAMGAISINTNAPSTNKSLDFSAEGGSYGTYSGTVVGNLPLTDNFDVRLALKGSHTDGIFHNELDDKTYGGGESFAGRLSAKWAITSDLTWTLRLDGTRSTGDGVNPQDVVVNSASPAQLAALNGFVEHFGGTPLVYSNTPSYDFNQVVGNPFNHDQQYGITSGLEWRLSPKLTFRLLDSYRDWTNSQLSPDIIGTSLNLIDVLTNTSSQAQSHELQLISSKDAYLDGKLGFTTGIYYFHEEFGIQSVFNLGSQFCGLVFGAVAPGLVSTCDALPQAAAGNSIFKQATDSYAGYAQVNYQIIPNVEIDLGARETADLKEAQFTAVTPNPLGVGALESAEGPEALKQTTEHPSYRASVSWRVTNRIMPFFTYSTGYKSGGFNSGPTSPPLGSQARTFGPETTTDYELGVKSIFWNGRVLLDATAFYTTLHDFQDRSFDGSAFLIQNSGDVRSRGIDLDGQIKPMSKLTLTFGATYLDIYTDDPHAPGLEGCTGLPGCPTVQNLSGRPIQFAPQWQGNGGFAYKIGSFLGGYTASLSGSVHFSSSFLTDNNDNPQSRLPGYYTTDLQLSFYSPDGKWQFDVFGTNISNEHYNVATIPQVLGAVIPGVSNNTTGATVYRGFLGDPARFGVRLSAKF